LGREKRGGGHGGRTLAAAFWAVLSGSFALEAREPNAEIFMNVCLVWVFAPLVHAHDQLLGAKKAVVIACLLTLGHSTNL
jgi:hypothetical protein